MTREEAIEQLQNCKDLIKQDGQDYLDERDFPLLDMAIEALQADRPSGEWIKHEVEDTCRWVECSECHKEYPNIEMNFCPNCGARMKGGGE